MNEQTKNMQTQLQQAPKIIENVLRNFSKTYQQNGIIKLAGIEPFDPDREGQGRYTYLGKGTHEKTESDVRVFLQKILPTLMQDNYSEPMKIRTLVHYTRGSARDFLSQYPQDGSVPLKVFVDDLDYYYQRRDSPHQLMVQLLSEKRKPGESILHYNLTLRKLADRIIRNDDNMKYLLMKNH